MKGGNDLRLEASGLGIVTGVAGLRLPYFIQFALSGIAPVPSKCPATKH